MGETHSFSLKMRMRPPHRLPPRGPPPLMRRLERRQPRIVREVVVRADLHRTVTSALCVSSPSFSFMIQGERRRGALGSGAGRFRLQG